MAVTIVLLKAAEGRRTPRRSREFRWRMNVAKRRGLRQSSGALVLTASLAIIAYVTRAKSHPFPIGCLTEHRRRGELRSVTNFIEITSVKL